jgi:hypothetical protein
MSRRGGFAASAEDVNSRSFLTPILFLRSPRVNSRANRRLSSGKALRFMALATIFLTAIAGAVQSTIDAGEFKSGLSDCLLLSLEPGRIGFWERLGFREFHRELSTPLDSFTERL